jgi:ABC-2 type transport system permease protein
VGVLPNEEAGRAALAQGKVGFVLNIPAGFTRSVLRGEHPALLVEADATDPVATGTALASVSQLPSSVAAKDLTGSLKSLVGGTAPFEVRVHRLYNPEGITQYNIIPGLMGLILTMTLALITGLAITRERERGTMENLLAMPVRPFEVILAKVIPYIVIGYVQILLILAIAVAVFGLPIRGSVALLGLGLGLFIASNLALGVTISTVARNQMQAIQMAQFTLLPSFILSGFMFPFRGMPVWAQWIGEIFPVTHTLRIVRGILLKGNGFTEIAADLWPIAVFTVAIGLVAIWSYRVTLD